ncbi:MAG TPA: glycosyltransferase [Bacteroidia bacterium]|jgi:rhamnopyranosyl-N-acetylglucosaminyl-diphospho-decaprenol beta-1,3/1,4-galactofuranosyltransferase|nr:glycosyltransferase [Bacteroidia bacterium]
MKNNIAILIVSFNRKDYVLKNIEAINKLTYKNHDIILFDNGSTDNTIETVSQLFPAVKIIKSDKNLGGAGGFAQGLEYTYTAGYEYHWCLDDDGRPDAHCLSILMEEAEKYDNNVVLGPQIFTDEEESANEHIWPLIGKYDSVKREVIEYPEEVKKDLVKSNSTFETASVALVGLFMHRTVIEKIGYPNLTFFIAGDDVEYCFRAWENNIKILLVQKATLYHPSNKATINLLFKKVEIIVAPPWKSYYKVRNSIYTSRLYLTRQKVVKLFLFHLCVMIYLLFNEKNKKHIFKSTIVGLYHAFTNKLGKYDL